MQIPLLAISNAISAVISFLVFVRLRSSYHEGGYTNTLVGHFASFFLLLSIFFILSSPALVWDRGSVDIVALQMLIAYLFLAFATGSFFRIPISVWFGYYSGKAVAWIGYGIGIIAFSLGLYAVHSARWFSLTQEGVEIYYFIFSQPAYIRILSGGVPLLIALIGSSFFVYEGLRASDVHIRARSLLMGFGMFLLMGAAFANFFISYVVFAFAVNLIASILALTGLLVMTMGIYLGSQKDKAL